MESLSGLNTQLGVIKGRDAIYLHNIAFDGETELTLTGEFNSNGLSSHEGERKFEMTFKGIAFLSMIELDFDNRSQMESLATVEHSEKIKEFMKLDHSSKVNNNHRHYYIRTYDTVFEIISDRFELFIEGLSGNTKL